MDVEYVAMTRGIGPCEFLARAQTRAGVGNRVIGIQPPCLQVEQMDRPGVAVAMVFGGRQIAVRGGGIDTREHGLRALKNLVVQSHPNRRQIDAVVDGDGLQCGALVNIV
jgi:hypothetical protein